ncbi:CheY-like protein [Sistotremastrum niveocremeum HHB9708]|uniref:CheY-like protein n=1 Tax=Sistotremastrum niveocremeum HHB9708 TaxID=1314777 RepID=A0A164RML4_9AGAM|nr:CheY-like protein [Sistotremastrum niveocremeum HHB9708]
MPITTNTASESPDGSHGSALSVNLSLGKDHLSAKFIEESASASEVLTQRKYALGIIEEASSWIVGKGMGTLGAEWMLGTPSGGGGSGGAGSDERESSEGSRSDRSMLFFSKTAVILLVWRWRSVLMMLVWRTLMKETVFLPHCAILEAANGKEALYIIYKQRPNLVLSDKMMPIMDEYELLQALRNRPDTRLIPVISLTAQAGDETKGDGLLSGSDDYLSKAFKEKELLARVKLRKRRAELEL